MARHGEGQFVAIETNIVIDPKLKGIGRYLKCSLPEAIGYVALWRVLVLTRGTGSGLVKGYSHSQVAEALEWRGRPSRILAALKAAGYLTTRRGSLVHPEWPDTITGSYAHRRQAQREYDRKRGRGRGVEGAAEEAGPGGDPSGSRPGPGGDPSGTRNGSGHQSTKAPPGAPLQGGEGAPPAPSDWGKWFLETYPKVRNPKKIRRLLAAMGADELAQLWYCLPLHAPRYYERQKTKGWRFVPFGDSYLEDGTFWEFRPPKPTANGNAAHAPAEAEVLAKQLDEEARREKHRQLLQQRAIVIEKLRDEGIAVKRGEPAFEELVEQRLEAGGGMPS